MKSKGRKKHVVVTHEGTAHARQLLTARKGPPTEADGPRRPSRPPRVLPGQIDTHGTTHGLDMNGVERQEGEAA
jgi:hypothetical protein